MENKNGTGLYFFVLAIGILFGIFVGVVLMDNFSNKEQQTEIKQTEIINNDVGIVSKIIGVDPNFDSTKNVPSYCIPENYSIFRINDTTYRIVLPGGTISVMGEFKTIVDAQLEINKSAKQSFKIWVETGGKDY